MSAADIHFSQDDLEPQAKRLKAAATSPLKVFRDGLFDRLSRKRIKKAVDESKPYKHCKIDDLINDSLLRKVRKEILDNVQFTLKETDIYKVNQTGDLANIDGLPKEEKDRLQHLFELRNGIYSQAFRDFVSEVTGCGPLSGCKTDMSVNIYNQGCHLLNHDDVIGDRRVSFILYMPDPDDTWLPTDGGALELYPVMKAGKSACEPSVSILPNWNQFVMFTVVPGYSFHSVEEVVSTRKSRLSIQGWFHLPQQHEPTYHEASFGVSNLQQASLYQLAAENIHDLFIPLEHDNATLSTNELKEKDRISLSTWMNTSYLEDGTIDRLAEQFMETSALQLDNILQLSLYESLVSSAYKEDKRDGYFEAKLPKHGSSVSDGWQVNGSPTFQRFLSVKKGSANNDDTITRHLFTQLENRFNSEAFRNWLMLLSKVVLKSYRNLVRRFRPGLDYTLATLPIEQHELLDVTFTLVTKQDPSWESCDVGGYLCYMASDDNNDDASVYRSSDHDGVLLTIPCRGNELSIILRDEGVLRFVKYVSANAKGSRWDISLEFETEDNLEI